MLACRCPLAANQVVPLTVHYLIAYAFIHTHNPNASLAEIFGEDMQFDVIIGYPPYQMPSDGGTRDQ